MGTKHLAVRCAQCQHISLLWAYSVYFPATGLALPTASCLSGHNIHPQQAPPTPRRPPYPATSHRLRVLRHPVAAVHLVRESVGVRAPSLCGFQHFPGERVTGNCTLSATSRPARNPHQVAAPFQSLQWNRPPVKRHLANYIPVQSCFQADEAAIRHTTRKTTTSTSE